MEWPNEDIKFVTDETFDFSLFSPADGLEEDLQRMTIEPRARCVAQTIDLNVFGGASEGRTREQSFQWNPLNPEKMEEIMKEANKLAAQLKECRLLEKEPPTSFLHVERGSVRSSRRETFNVNDSPLKALLPTVKLETYSAPDSPRAAIAKERSPVHCTARSPIPKRLQNKQTNCSPDSQLSKNTSNSPKTLTTKKPLATKKATTKSNRMDRSTPLSLPNAIQKQETSRKLKPSLRTKRKDSLSKTEGAFGQASSAKEPKLSLQDLSSKTTVPAAHVTGKLGPRLCSSQTSPVKKTSAIQEKLLPLQKANASEIQAKGKPGPKVQPSSKPRSSSCQVPTRSLVSQLPVPAPMPKAIGRNIPLSRHAIPRTASQLKQLSVGVSGRKGSAIPAVKRDNSACHP